jgi:hypothetical protein
VLWIRFGFTADPDPAFYLNADPYVAKPMRKPQKVEFLRDKFT